MGEYQAEIRGAVQNVSRVVKTLATKSRQDSPNENPEFQAALEYVEQLREGQEALMKEAMDRLGVTEEDLEEIETEKRRALPRGIPDLIQRAELVSENVTPTKTFDDILPDALDTLLNIVDPAWLRSQAALNFRLDDPYLHEELSIVSGSRVSRTLPPHRFAEHLLVAQDFLAGHPNYDFWTGAQSVPVVAILGSALDALKEVKGNVEDRLRSLHLGHAGLVDSTIYELLVAAACVRRGRLVEMLEPDNKGKTPDLRLHDLDLPFVVECKRRPPIIEYEHQEEQQARQLFQAAYAECQRLGISGILEAQIACELNEISPARFAEDVRRLVLYGMHQHATNFEWGSLTFRELPQTIKVPPTRLYSPDFSEAVFNWNMELPDFDGMLCQVHPPEDLVTDNGRNALALKWTSASGEARAKKTRPVGSLLGKAIKQIPLGEMGAIFMCFQEGAIADVADERTRRIEQEMHGWTHDWGIQIPVMFVNRLFPRPIGEGLPDLIENVFQFRAADADPVFQELIPSAVFTYPLGGTGE